ncbi:hypothetical protein [Pseudomonas sp. PB106]|uniref:hypothetical protein n=1 Tax=Pseudomonas sp. PB106 TaxID=2494699 RepID=UPI00131A626C|nr:hypothetical protein [Pseudomonas sp. PB106]KAE9645528.1 hypothetical protein EJA71_11425 [Pseudomonas sp. PB106]
MGPKKTPTAPPRQPDTHSDLPAIDTPWVTRQDSAALIPAIEPTPTLIPEPAVPVPRVQEEEVESGIRVEDIPISPADSDEGASAAKEPRVESSHALQTLPAAEHIDISDYLWNEAAANHHGYLLMHRKQDSNDASDLTPIHAFRDDNGLLIRVEPSATRLDEPAELLPAWTDRDLWNLYGIQGADITRFRTEAHATGKKPQWANIRADRMETVYLLDELRRWTSPDMDRDLFLSTLQAFNFTPAQLAKKLGNVNLRWKTVDTPTASATAQAPGIRTDAPGFAHPSHYHWDSAHPSHQGYIELHRKPELNDSFGPPLQLAFRSASHLFIVKPTDYWNKSLAPLCRYWRDVDIWNLYRIQGEDIVRFRQEVAQTGKAPAWVTLREYYSRRAQLIDHLRLWTSPHAVLNSLAVFIAKLRPYNLSTEQLSQLCDELGGSGQFPHRINDELPRWVEAHRESVLDEANSRRFDPFVSELRAEMLTLRYQEKGQSFLQSSLTPTFFQGLLLHCGFQRNVHNCLFRTDIPAMFRGDDRSPFEFARDGSLLPRTTLAEGTTSQSAVSATLSLRVAMKFAQQANAQALAYDSQLHRFPGKTDNPGQSSRTDSELHLTHDYTPKREAQQFGFCYLLDTRDVEVVPGRDNQVYNAHANNPRPQASKTWFPDGELEGHISMSARGLSVARVWLVNSQMNRAALVEDVYIQALQRAGSSGQNHADAIEARTWSGASNRHEYDTLIDEVAAAGKRIMVLAKGAETVADDIHFPPPLITLDGL